MIEMIMDQQRAITAQQTHHFILLSPDQSPSLPCTLTEKKKCRCATIAVAVAVIALCCCCSHGYCCGCALWEVGAHLSQGFDVILQMMMRRRRRRKMEWRIHLERKVFG
jgi:hypothetical protein